MFYVQYFLATFRSQKKKEFLLLKQNEGMSVAKYQARFLTLERFPPISFSSQRESTTHIVSGLHIGNRSMAATISCLTLVEAMMRALEYEHAYKFHLHARGIRQFNCKR